MIAVFAGALTMYVVAVLSRHLFRGTEWDTFQGRKYPLRPWHMPFKSPAMVNPRVGWRSRGMPDPIVRKSQFDEVRQAAEHRANGEWFHSLFREWGVDLDQAVRMLRECEAMPIDEPGAILAQADLVKMDHPQELATLLSDHAQKAGIPFRRRKTRRSHIDFLGPMTASPAWFAVVLWLSFRATFRAKPFFGVERPNEEDGSQLGPYTHPDHMADPAGHGDGAGVTARWLWKRFDWRSTEEFLPYLHACVAWAMFRTTGAQVHRNSENIRGFVLGWSIHRSVIYLPPFGSYDAGLRELSEFFPQWPTLLESGR